MLVAHRVRREAVNLFTQFNVRVNLRFPRSAVCVLCSSNADQYSFFPTKFTNSEHYTEYGEVERINNEIM